MFKEKSSKKKINFDTNETYTLDAMHNNMIKKFEKTDKDLQYHNTMLNNYEQSSNIIFHQLNNDNNDKDTINLLWTSNVDLREKIIETKHKIKELNNNYDEIEYYKNTSYILFQYYDTIDNQSHINNALVSTTNIIKSSIDMPNKQGRKIYKNEAKNKKSNSAPNSINVLDALNNVSNQEQSNIKDTDDNSDIEDLVDDKSTLVDKYMSIINKKYVRNVEDDNIEICKDCKSKMICLQQDAIMICNTCGYQELLLVEQNRPILKQNTKDTSHFCYKRINHFREWCNQVQGKESTDIPDEIFEKLV